MSDAEGIAIEGDISTSRSARGVGRGVGAAVVWACFLASSWTWVIGMFFPVLLLRDYGVAGWWVFVVPNVIGAAAMGFVLPSAAASRRVTDEHLNVAIRFSDVTVAFHVFAVGWIGFDVFGPTAVLAAAAVGLVVWAMAFSGRGLMLAAAVGATVVSLGLFGYWQAGAGGWQALLTYSAPPRLTVTDLALFAPASVLGFLLCPYLDLTFHRARQATDGPTGKAAFVLGFGVIFLVMIVFSLFYAPVLVGMLEPGVGVTLSAPVKWIIELQLIVQAGLTVGLHVNEVGSRRGHAGVHRTAAFVIVGGALAYWAVTAQGLTGFGITVGEAIYRCFIVFYGMVFPGYVWLVMLWPRGVALRRRVMVWLVASVVAAPMAFAFIVAGRSWWILGVLGVLGAGRLVVEGMGRGVGEGKEKGSIV